MRPLHQAEAAELASLQMENELLSHETRHLRAQLKQAEREIRRLKGQDAQQDLQTALQQARARAQRQSDLRVRAQQEAKRATRQLRKYKRAHDDLVWLLQRLSSSPAGPLLRRRPGFQAMCQRYGVGR